MLCVLSRGLCVESELPPSVGWRGVDFVLGEGHRDRGKWMLFLCREMAVNWPLCGQELWEELVWSGLVVSEEEEGVEGCAWWCEGHEG